MPPLRLAVLAFALASCGSTCQRPGPAPDWVPYAREHCPAQCARLVELGCSEGAAPCADKCLALVERRLWTPTDIACVSGAGDVEAVRACRVRCVQ